MTANRKVFIVGKEVFSMTVINAMRFNEKAGGMVADSQGSRYNRKYNTTQKISSLKGKKGNVLLFGGSGAGEVLYESGERLGEHFGEEADFTTRDFVFALSDTVTRTGREFIDASLRSQFGLETAEYLAGKTREGVPIGDHVLSNAKDLFEMDKTRLLEGGFLVLGQSEGGVLLYSAPNGHRPLLSSEPCGSIGSGTDESDRVLHEFRKNLPRAETDNIDPLRGMEALIRATYRSSDLNQGVGGVPTVSYFNDEKGIVMLDEDRSLLATEIVRVGDEGIIERDRTLEALQEVLSNKRPVMEIEDGIFSGERYVEISRFLRGYKKNGVHAVERVDKSLE